MSEMLPVANSENTDPMIFTPAYARHASRMMKHHEIE